MFLLVAACAVGATTTTTTPPILPDVELAGIQVGDTDLTVWVADTSAERSQGLRGVNTLPGGVDGMLFVWDTPVTPTFGMRDTLLPLDLWWFAPDGSLIGLTEMDTCPDGDCVSYGAPEAVSWALETPAGTFQFERGEILTTS